MNAQEKAKQQAEVMLAWVNGAEIEVSSYGESDWAKTLTPRWDWSALDYRVKVVPKVVKYYCYTDGHSLLWLHDAPVAQEWKAVPSEDKEVLMP